MARASKPNKLQKLFLKNRTNYFSRDRRLGVDKPIFTSLVQLAISVLYNLDLDKAHFRDMGFILMQSVRGDNTSASQTSRVPTMEERRAVLGCYLISTVLVDHDYINRWELLEN